MPDNNKLELVVEVDVNKANASIKSVNTGLSSMEQAASKAAHGASAGTDGMTASMVKGATAGNLLADAIKKGIEWAKDWTLGAVQMAAHEARLEASMKALAKAHGVSESAAMAQAEAVRKIGFYGEEASHTSSRLIISDMDLAKGVGLAKMAKDAAAIENISPGEAMEKLLLAIESGTSRGLRSMGIFVDLNKDVDRQEKLTGKTLDENEVRQLRYNAVMREGAKIQGAAAAAAGTAEGQGKILAREVIELKEAIGAEFQGYRLPTALEWWWAAQGPDDSMTYPWELLPYAAKTPPEYEDDDPKGAVAREWFQQYRGASAEVLLDSGWRSAEVAYDDDIGPFGTIGLIGNVKEWVQDLIL